MILPKLLYSIFPPPFHDIISIRKALKLCPSIKTPNGMVKKVKVKQSRYRPEVAQRVPGS